MLCFRLEEVGIARKRRRALIVVSVFVIAAAALGAVIVTATRASAEDQPAHLHLLGGEVNVRSGSGSFAPGQEGETLVAGDAVATGPDGRAEIRYFDGSITRVDASTTFTVARLATLKNRVHSKRIVGYQQGGSTLQRVTKLADSESRVTFWSASVAAVVRGTTFTVGITPDGATTVAVRDGSVALERPQGTQIVGAGQKQTIPFTGPCVAFLNGLNLDLAETTDAAIPVDVNAGAVIVGRSSAPITGHEVTLEVAGRRFTASSGSESGTTWNGEVNPSKYARYGSGVYKLNATTTGPGGCTKSAFIRFTGKPWYGTLAGVAGMVAAGAGVAGTELNVASALTKGSGPGRAGLGGLTGLLVGGGTLIVLQQSAAAYPTALFTLLILGAGLLAGILLPLILRRRKPEPPPETPTPASPTL